MFAPLKEVQQESQKACQKIFNEAVKLGKKHFVIVDITQSIGQGKHTKYKSNLQVMEYFSASELSILGFNTMVTAFELDKTNSKYIKRTLYHVLDREHVVAINKMDEIQFNKLLKSKELDETARFALKSSRENSRRLLYARK